MRPGEEFKKTDDPSVYKKLSWLQKFKKLGGCCLSCPLKPSGKGDLKSWKTRKKSRKQWKPNLEMKDWLTGRRVRSLELPKPFWLA